MSGNPLTKLLHNGSVQVGTWGACMGCKRGSTGFTAVWSLPWPLGLALGDGTFSAIRNGVLWLLLHQSDRPTQDLNQSIAAKFASITQGELITLVIGAQLLKKTQTVQSSGEVCAAPITAAMNEMSFVVALGGCPAMLLALWQIRLEEVRLSGMARSLEAAQTFHLSEI